MNQSTISFQVRIRDHANLEILGERVARALKLSFVPSEANYFAGDPALECYALGLWITLSGDPEVPDGKEQTYILMGMLDDYLESIWEVDTASNSSISKYILQVLHSCDSNAWYISNKNELYDEAGLMPK